MRFDPVADPWGAAMLAAAVLWLLALLVVLAAFFARTSKRTGGHLMLVSMLVFLGAAAGGTWSQVQGGDAVAVAPAPEEPPAPSPRADARAAGSEGHDPPTASHGPTPPATGNSAEGTAAPSDDPGTGSGDPTPTGDTNDGPGTTSATTGHSPDPSTGGDAPDTDAPEPGTDTPAPGTDTPEPGTDTPEPGTDTPEPGTDTPEPIVKPSEPVIPADLPEIDPLPTEPSARQAAIREILDEAERAAGGGQRCGNLKRVAQAWARLRAVPPTRKAKGIAADLERCRRRLLYSISQKRLAEMVEARDAWFEKLPSKIRKQHGLIVQASISGGSHERLRIGNRELDATRADAIMDAGLRDDLVRLEFAHVVLSNGKRSKTYALPVTAEGELGLPWLRAVGLGEPLRLEEAP